MLNLLSSVAFRLVGLVKEALFMVIVSCFEGGFGKTNVRLLWLTAVRFNCSLIH